ncbi:unnamed protein product [Fusarium graminearum]|uniref:Uncharacterized protein n=1 Tax=Gibberella zeae TaxID=5518 RepID=A0A679NXK6_GIBZA|nr:hypothetical protein FG05_35212 [Fusarium graminearum]CAF3478384.1 unnamed protein product [Fusarium graminearum]CAF3516552.1 unnamed protein product [Fusarium graminearum]CAG1969390.1 unnamed protein product [Fusarium graminearum]CAG1990912.1 unnamed protein product [Fusarium graminearum]
MCFETTEITRCKTCRRQINTVVWVQHCPRSIGITDHKQCPIGVFATTKDLIGERAACEKVREEEERKKSLGKK